MPQTLLLSDKQAYKWEQISKLGTENQIPGTQVKNNASKPHPAIFTWIFLNGMFLSPLILFFVGEEEGGLVFKFYRKVIATGI